MRTIAMLIAMVNGCYVLLGVLLYFTQERMVFLARLPGRALEATPRHAGFDYVDAISKPSMVSHFTVGTSTLTIRVGQSLFCMATRATYRIVSMAAHLYPYMPVRLISRLRYPVADYVARVECPVVIVHSRDDEIILFAMGRALYEVAPAPKAFIEFAGDHNNGFVLFRDR